ncbi:MAG: hypothetical protein ACFFBI_09275 [Promethearchaeota archaeon]
MLKAGSQSLKSPIVPTAKSVSISPHLGGFVNKVQKYKEEQIIIIARTKPHPMILDFGLIVHTIYR